MDCSEMRMCEFIESRAAELENLLDRIQVISSNNQVFQRLPKHIRRRAMSHNKKRLPRKLRDEAIAKEMLNEAKNPSKPGTKKRTPNRKQRRRPSRLLAEFAKRQRRVRWLPTHIWHAKRFFMVDKWGFRIARKSTERTFRANYRAQSAHRSGCQLIDVSYMRCIHISSLNRDLLISGLKQLLPPAFASAQSFNEATLIDGQMRDIVLYHPGRYPYGAICRAELICRPSGSKSIESQPQFSFSAMEVDETQSIRHSDAIWIWLHPTCLDEVMTALREAFAAQRAKMEHEVSGFHLHDEVKVEDVSDRLSRFRLAGNRAIHVLRKVLEVADHDLSTRAACERSRDFVLTAIDLHKQNEAVSADEQKRSRTFKLKKLTKQLFELKAQRCDVDSAVQKFSETDQDSTAKLASTAFNTQPCDAAFSFNVRDPRLLVAGRARRKSIGRPGEADESPDAECGESNEAESQNCVRLSSSFSLWDQAENAEHLVPIEPLKNSTLNDFLNVLGHAALRGSIVDAHVPILLIRRSGYVQRSGAFSHDSITIAPECTLIVPAEFSRAFWLALVHANVRVGGLLDLQYSELMRDSIGYPESFPDSASGRREDRAVCDAVRERELRRPPSKRRHYGETDSTLDSLDFLWWKLVVGAPRDLQTNDEELFYVLRDLRVLLQLDELLHSTTEDGNQEREATLKRLIDAHRRALVPVRIQFLRVRRSKCGSEYSLAPVGRGMPQRFDLVLLPKVEDFDANHAERIDCGSTEVETTGLVRLRGKTGDELESDRALIGQLKLGDFALNRGQAIGLGFCSLTGFAAASRVSHLVRKNSKMESAAAASCFLTLQPQQTVALLGNPNLHRHEYRFIGLEFNLADAF